MLRALRGAVSSSYVKDTFRRDAMEFPEGTGAFRVLQGRRKGAQPCGESLPNQYEIRAAAV